MLQFGHSIMGELVQRARPGIMTTLGLAIATLTMGVMANNGFVCKRASHIANNRPGDIFQRDTIAVIGNRSGFGFVRVRFRIVPELP